MFGNFFNIFQRNSCHFQTIFRVNLIKSNLKKLENHQNIFLSQSNETDFMSNI